MSDAFLFIAATTYVGLDANGVPYFESSDARHRRLSFAAWRSCFYAARLRHFEGSLTTIRAASPAHAVELLTAARPDRGPRNADD